jgi:putative SOS response-associated peptidase YedK
MCGRYNLKTNLSDVAREFRALVQRELPLDPQVDRPRTNISPTQFVAIIREDAAARTLAVARWGLVPSWSRDTKLAASMINARGETVADKPAFRTAFRKRRCLIPADAFYEWQAISGTKQKQPLLIQSKPPGLLAFAGLWETWRDPAATTHEATMLETTTIITTSANALMAPVHDRMPVILPPEQWDVWLDPQTDPAILQPLLVPAPDDGLTLSLANPDDLRRGVW